MLRKLINSVLNINDAEEINSRQFTSPISSTFTHIFVKRVGDTVYVYLNNVLVGSGIVGTKHLEMDSDNRVGMSQFNSNPFNGEIKLLHFYNYALSDADRTAIHTQES